MTSMVETHGFYLLTIIGRNQITHMNIGTNITTSGQTLPHRDKYYYIGVFFKLVGQKLELHFIVSISDRQAFCC